MDRHDETQATETASKGTRQTRILIVGGEAEERARLSEVIQHRGYRCTHVSHLEMAQVAVRRHRFDVLIVNTTLPDGSGLDLIEQVHETRPTTKIVAMLDAVADDSALDAVRRGAIDVITLPTDAGIFLERIESALRKSDAERQRERRIRRLQEICQELSTARREISDQVDSLCNELVVAYQELTQQLDEVAMTSEFRTLLRMELDVEEVLRTTLEYLLTKTGPTNAAVFLPDPEHQYSLGAYVNYDCPRTSIDSVLNHLCQAICPQMAEEQEIVAFDDAREFATWIGLDDGFFADSNVIAFSCQHGGECLAVLVLFRNQNDPFPEDLATPLDILRTIFAEQLSRLIDVHHRAQPSWPDDVHDDDYDEYGFGFDLAA